MPARYRVRLRRAGVVAVGTLVSLVTLTGTASAHAVLEHSSPAAGSLQRVAPSAVVLTFDESVLAAGNAIHVYDDRLRPIETGPTTHPGGHGDEIAVAMPAGQRPGTYTVTWRVTSADTHVVSGSFEFSVGHRTTVAGPPPALRPDRATTVAAGLLRGLGYAGLVSGPGGLLVALWLWPAGLAMRRTRRLVAGGGLLLGLVTVLGFAVQGALSAGVPLSRALSGSALHLGVEGRFGRAGLDRLVLLLTMFELVVLVRDVRRRRRLVTVAALGLAATWPYAGHAASGSLVPLAFLADLVHVAAMAVWLGGLILVATCLLSAQPPDASSVVRRFSELALAAVSLIVATGTFAAWRNVRHWGAFLHTTYGVLLLVKIGLVVVLLAAAAVTRRHTAGSLGGAASLPRLRRSVAVEAVIAAAILGVTSALTGTAQADEVYAPPFTQSATDNGVVVTVHLDRTRVGTTELVVTTRQTSGAVQTIREITGSLTELDPPVGPLPIMFRPDGVGREVASVLFPDQGSWRLQLDVRTSAINEIEVSATVPVR